MVFLSLFRHVSGNFVKPGLHHSLLFTLALDAKYPQPLTAPLNKQHRVADCKRAAAVHTHNTKFPSVGEFASPKSAC
jgi:hypothetical protein